MELDYHVVKLLQNRRYPTFQLHGFMASRKTAPADGLRLGALIAMDWLRKRLGEDASEALRAIPEPSAFRTVGNDCLPSFHQNSGFVVDIVSLPERGLWTMQITEPDLGSSPGDPSQARQPVAGRVFETNVSYRISGKELECGFQTVISDPAGTAQPADVYRLAFIRSLMAHPDFGLRQGPKLSGEWNPVSTKEDMKQLLALWRSEDNQLPCVVFSHLREKPQMPELPKFDPMAFRPDPLLRKLEQPKNMAGPRKPDYDLNLFAKRTEAFGRTYLLADALLEQFGKELKKDLKPGNIVVLEPRCFRDKPRIIECYSSGVQRKEAFEALLQEIRSYPRGKEISFGGIGFLSAAREKLLSDTQSALHDAGTASREWEQRLEQLNAGWQDELSRRDQAQQELLEKLERQKAYSAQLEREKEQLRNDQKTELAKQQAMMDRKDQEIAFLKRKLAQPEEHEDVADWVKAHFADRLILHPHAVDLLKEKSARDIDIHLICDALDYLATDYWSQRFERISKEEMLSRCSRKYGRPFEVKPTGETTIKFSPEQYHIKYFPGLRGKAVDSPLDYHLGVGNDPENLLRIYFLHDDEKQKIVVGSLPRHLRAVSVR